jgi:hypothetical protein
MLKTVAKYNTYMIDYIYFGDYHYMLAVNVNTRKAYTVTVNSKDKYEAIRALDNLIREQHVKIEHIIKDNEKAWDSDVFKQYLKDHHIDYYNEIKYRPTTNEDNLKSKSKVNNSCLSILNRLVRTIREMMLHMKIPQNQCKPNIMKYIIDEYNSSPHKTLSKIFHHKVAPNDVDYFMENVIINYAMQHNQSIMNDPEYNVELGSRVQIFNDPDPMQHGNPKIIDGDWYVYNREGSYYIIKNANNNSTIKVPRWMFKRN